MSISFNKLRATAFFLSLGLLAGCRQQVPDVVGMQESEAVGVLEAAGFGVGTVSRQTSETVEAGVVISQDAAGGEQVEEGSAVDLVVSLGAAPVDVVVPDVTGLDRVAAHAAVVGAGLVLGATTREFSDTVPYGHVIRQSPAAGGVAGAGTSVDVVISNGGEPTAVPDVTGMTVAEAEAALAAAGFTAVVVEEYDDTAAAGTVVSQGPAPEMIHGRGGSVTLVVSRGPAPIPAPRVVGMTLPGAESALRYSMLTLGAATEQYDNEMPLGRVVSQDPLAGTVLHRGDPVSVAISKGPEPVPVPLVEGLSLSEAEAAVAAAGLVVGTVTEEYAPSLPPVTVIRQDPQENEYVLPGAAVDLVISTDIKWISSVEELQLISNHRDYPFDAKYALANDIDASATADWNDGAGFLPLGYDPEGSDDEFTGTFDGRGHTITGLVMRKDIEVACLFTTVGSAGRVFDLHLRDCIASSSFFAGGITILNRGTIARCSVSGVFGRQAGLNTSGPVYVGGIAGLNGSGLIQDCVFTGLINGGRTYAGGIAAWNDGTIQNCRFTGELDVPSSGQSFSGGIVGLHGGGTITDCTASGILRARYHIGGIGGWNLASITRCNSACQIKSEEGMAGGVAAENGGSITECGSASNVWNYGRYEGYSSGGFVCHNSGSINQCFAVGDVSCTNISGGFAAINTGVISDSLSASSAKANEFCGGFTGRNEGTVTRCYAMGSVETPKTAGGLVALNWGTVSDSFWCVDLTGQQNSAGGDGITLAQLLDPATFTAAGWDYANSDGNPPVWAQIAGVTVPYPACLVEPGASYTLDISAVNGTVNATPTAGALAPWTLVTLQAVADQPEQFAGWWIAQMTQEDPIETAMMRVLMHGPLSIEAVFLQRPVEIDSLAELQQIGNDAQHPLSWDYVLTTDLDAGETAEWNGGAGFEPIGEEFRPFGGTFDSQGHEIRDLFINRPYEGNVALFSAVAEGGAIADLRVLDANVTGRYSAGLIAGTSQGTISNCRVSGCVTGDSRIGGIAGINGPMNLDAYWPSMLPPGLIYRCQAAVSVACADYLYGYGEDMGGVVGANTATIRESSATGSVTGYEEIGGFCGQQVLGLMEDCYAICTVTGADLVGGFVGMSAYATTRRSYSASHVVCEPYRSVGGFTGEGDYYTNQDACFWDGEVSGLWWSPSDWVKSTADMMSAATFMEAGWDFANVWGIDEGNSYPYLLWEVAPGRK